MKLSLLIVDDDEVMRDTLSDVLKKKGYEVSVASSGNEALSAIRKNIVDLIIDAGPSHSEQSTVLDLTEDRPIVVREGSGDVSFLSR